MRRFAMPAPEGRRVFCGHLLYRGILQMGRLFSEGCLRGKCKDVTKCVYCDLIYSGRLKRGSQNRAGVTLCLSGLIRRTDTMHP